MIARIVVEPLFENMTEATVGAWLKREGDAVTAGDPLVELITDKVTVEIGSPSDGVLRHVLAPEKSVVPLGYVMALVGNADEPLPDVEKENRKLLLGVAAVDAVPRTETRDPRPLRQSGCIGPQTDARSPVRATPAARRLARQLGLDLSRLATRMEGKIITEEDVREFTEKERT